MPTIPDPAVLSRIDRLELEARQVVEGYLSGRHRSPRHGFAVEFAQHREYAPGDDIKHIDWKVYGRTERFHLKQYEQETNLVAWLLVDASESMAYGSGPRSKYDLACGAAAAMAYLVLNQTDAVGVATLAGWPRAFLRPSGQLTQLREACRVMVEGPFEGPAELGRVLNGLAGRTGRRINGGRSAGKCASSPMMRPSKIVSGPIAMANGFPKSSSLRSKYRNPIWSPTVPQLPNTASQLKRPLCVS
jgi:hypothetical protein